MIANLRHARLTVGIPMGALIPREIDGLLAAGRCMGVDHDFAACLRMKRDMEKSGEAAAAIAALAVRRGSQPRELPYGEVAEALRATGCLDEAQSEPFYDSEKWRLGERFELRLPDDPQALRDGLASGDPACALWSARGMGQRAVPFLRAWVQSPNEVLSGNSALALGMRLDEAALAALRRMAHRLEPSAPPTAKYPTGCRAICLLGRMADEPSTDWLLRVLTEDALFDGIDIAPDDFYNTRSDYRTHFFLHAFVALLSIARCHPARRVDILPALRRLALSPDFHVSLSHGNLLLTETMRDLLLSECGMP